ncbi:hypothetical protein MIND_00401400 [Mycena indigotica]|uniref:Uncharacterized protein n=1 Tax=Mycena indigotica TaxID=2126181 RepID=A0A8H6W932_9AGAR|nr:uncharacterized protein MIND_00401400 [Mycena indigotica]KAF7310274.1 hypothetical protein MIND_00401400 [Mycena indigotica]
MAPSSVDIATSTLIALFVEAVLYGLFILLFALAMSVLLGKRKRSASGTRPLLVASITMFILGTIHIAIDLRRAMDSFLYHKNIAPVSTPGYLLKSTAYAMQTLVGDSFMIYRVYLVWNGDKRVLFPLLVCLLGGFAAGAGALQSFAATKHATTGDPIFLINLHNWIVSFFSLTLFTNATCTLLIAGRIYLINRSTAASATVFGRGLGPAIMIIVESGAIYSCALVILLALYVQGSYAQYILLDAETQIVGVVFTMIIVRVGMGLATDITTYAGSRSGAGSGPKFRSHVSGARSGGPTATLELSPRAGVSVTTTQEVKHDGDSGEGQYVYTKGGDMWHSGHGEV